MDSKAKPTIKDIARLTGLSKGTVDRVLHNRAGVSRKSYEKVAKAIRDMGYEPNLHASILAQHKERTIVVMLPDSSGGDFWELFEGGIARSKESSARFGISVVRTGYDQNDLESFRAACTRVLDLAPSGVVIAPMFRDETLLFADRLRGKGIPYVYVDTRLEEDSDYLAFYGMPAYLSGVLCASLITDSCRPEELEIVRIKRDKAHQSDPTVQRRRGFMDYMEKNCPDCRIGSIFIDPACPDKTLGTLEAALEGHPGLRHIVMFNSRVHLLSDFLERHGGEGIRVVGFDNLTSNVESLRKGLVHTLITQRPDEQVFSAVATLADFNVFGRKPSQKDNFVHMDILTRYNIDYY